MKIEDLSDDEVLSLTDEEVKATILYRMAEAGIPVLPEPAVPVYDDVPGPDVQVYEIAGVMFTDRDAAEKVQAAIMEGQASRVRLDYGSSYENKYVMPDRSDQDVTTRTAYSQESHALHKEMLDRNSRRRNAYDTEQTAWRRAEREAESIRAGVLDRVREAEDKARQIEFLQGRYAEYIEIAGGDKEMALEFLKKAFPGQVDATTWDLVTAE